MTLSLLSQFAQGESSPIFSAGGGWSTVTWVSLLIAMGLMPFALTMVTSFAKLVIVGGIIRQALGMQQIPPTTVVTGLALILTVHIMSPVILTTWDAFDQEVTQRSEEGAEMKAAGDESEDINRVKIALLSAEDPMRDFLERHTDQENIELFRVLLLRLQGPDQNLESPLLEEGTWFETAAVLAPAFLLTELTEAFQIGFLIFVPFLIIDLVVSNLLLAMGMHMLSPTVVSLPLKLLLFVLIDGWALILQGLVLGYTAI